MLAALHSAGLDVIKTENLYRIGGAAAYSLGQGEQQPGQRRSPASSSMARR